MFSVNALGYIYQITKVEDKPYNNPTTGKVETFKKVMFVFKSKRKELTQKKDANGNVVVNPATGQPEMERISDFILCKAYGKTAEFIANNMNQKLTNEVGSIVKDAKGNDKLIPIRCLISGNIETYMDNRRVEFTQTVALAGNNYNIPIARDVETKGFCINVKEIELADWSAIKTNTLSVKPVSTVNNAVISLDGMQAVPNTTNSTVTTVNPTATVETTNHVATTVATTPVPTVKTGNVVNNDDVPPTISDDDIPF